MLSKKVLRRLANTDSCGRGWQEGVAMMGRQDRDQGSLFNEFNLDAMISQSHLLRRIDASVTAVFMVQSRLRAWKRSKPRAMIPRQADARGSGLHTRPEP
jgi:hypothetical protein